MLVNLKSQLFSIYKDLPFSLHSKHSFFLFKVTSNPAILDEITHAANVDELLLVIQKIESKIYKYINKEAYRIDINTPLIMQSDELKNIKICIEILTKANKTLLNEIENVLAVNPVNNQIINNISDRIDVIIADEEKCPARTKIFLQKIKNMITVSLLKSSQTDVGRKLVENLNNLIIQKDHRIQLHVHYSQIPNTIRTEPVSEDALAPYATSILENTNKSETIRSRCKNIQKSTGAESAIVIPVWPELKPSNQAYTNLVYNYFTNDHLIEKSLDNILCGSFSFSKNGRLFYMAIHFDFIHELIHVLHNSKGNNRATINTLTELEIKIWKDAEEYWTIAGGNKSVNQLTSSFQQPEQHGHGGFSAVLVIDPQICEEAFSPPSLLNLG